MFRSIIFLPIILFVVITGMFVVAHDSEKFFEALCPGYPACNYDTPCTSVHEDYYQTCHRTYYCDYNYTWKVKTISNICIPRYEPYPPYPWRDIR